MKNLLFKFITAILIITVTSPAHGEQDVTEHANCRTAFYAAVDGGLVNSVNGVAIASGFTRYYYTARINGQANIFEGRCINGKFRAGEAVFEQHEFEDYQPVLSIDDRRLCFTSSRPIAGDTPVRQNIWCGTTSSNFVDVAPIEALVSPYWDGHATEIEKDLWLFASERAANQRMVEIFQYDGRDDNKPPIPVATLNSPLSDNDMTYDMHTGLLVFSRYDPDTRDIDLFAARRSGTDWSPVQKLQSLSNSNWNLSPAFTPDGQYLLFKNGDEPFVRVAVDELLVEIQTDK